MLRIIKTESNYKNALAEIDNLLEKDPDTGTPDADRLELLTLLVQDYESQKFRVPLPDPIDAILFRMEQQSLSQKDLVPYIGSRSKVSEILSRKRPLSLSMIRALHAGLGIPARVLLYEQDSSLLKETDVEWDRFPLREMIRRGWIQEKISDIQDQTEEVLRRFFAKLGSEASALALYRKMPSNTRSARSMDEYALLAWTARVIIQATDNPPPGEYHPETVTPEFMREIAQLSWSEQGPVLAKEFLEKHGVSLIIESHLPKTHLDGAAILLQDGKRPIIGLTLRHDRLDNFWFCLMHELAHISLHLDEKTAQFYDDLDVESQDDPREGEADKVASEALIPEEVWRKSPASRLRTPEAVQHLAGQLRIHPALVAGRMRHQFNSYRILNQLVGHNQVRKSFPKVDWS